PMIDLPLARPARNASTLEVVRLNTATVNPWLAMLSTRFSPITARPISPMSAVARGVVMSLGPESLIPWKWRPGRLDDRFPPFYHWTDQRSCPRFDQLRRATAGG